MAHSRLSMRTRPPVRMFAPLVLILTAVFGDPAGADEPSPKPAKPDASTRVLTKEEEGRRGSNFLKPPGSGKYEPAEDWRDVPAWRQTSFFGIRARGQFFVYVVDCSGSMEDEDRLIRAKDELRRSVLSLIEPQKFKVIFYNDEALPMPGDLPRSADVASKSQMLAWLRTIDPDGGTDPRSAMGLAFSLRPDAVFLLSDGEFPDGAAEAIGRKNARKIPVHCINLGSGPGDQLQRIARDSGGRYVIRRWAGP